MAFGFVVKLIFNIHVKYMIQNSLQNKMLLNTENSKEIRFEPKHLF
jgi:hypothetical protein